MKLGRTEGKTVPSQRPLERLLSTPEGPIELSLNRSRRKTLCIHIHKTGGVEVRAPFITPLREIDAFIQQKSCWIQKKIRELRRFQRLVNNRQYVHGQEFFFLGKAHRLIIHAGDHPGCRITFNGHQWIVEVDRGIGESLRVLNIKESLIEWYRNQAKEILGARIFHFARLLGVSPEHVLIRTQRHMWGSCNHSKKSIHLNWQIILSPMAIIDYVIVHELFHLRVPNHSHRFWDLVAKIIPDYRDRRRWLKENWHKLVLP